MRLWHERLIPYLPRQQLLGQHRECCALRGRGWARRHSTVDYAWRHGRRALFRYHLRVMNEMTRRGYRPAREWRRAEYRGRALAPKDPGPVSRLRAGDPWAGTIYPEHDDEYLQECLSNLADKGINLAGV